jgi:hypothetical protein
MPGGEEMSELTLYLVTADTAGIDDFECAVVYATSAEDAVRLTQAEIARPPRQRAPGAWEPTERGATLTAVPVPIKYGAVLGHSVPC